MDINSKLPEFKTFLSENRLNNGGVKTSIDQSAVAPSEQEGVGLNVKLEESLAGKDKNKKKKDKKNSTEKKTVEQNSTSQKKQETKLTPLQLLNLI